MHVSFSRLHVCHDLVHITSATSSSACNRWNQVDQCRTEGALVFLTFSINVMDRGGGGGGRAGVGGTAGTAGQHREERETKTRL